MNFWTDEMVAALRRLTADGLSCSQIAGALRASSRNAIIGKQHRIGLRSLNQPSRWRPRMPKPKSEHSGETIQRIRIKANGARPAVPIRIAEPRPASTPHTIAARDIPFLERRMGRECAFITSDAWPHTCCGLLVVEAQYCAEHARRCFNGFTK